MAESIYTDSLRLTPQGEQALANANAGGIVIRPVSFQCGDYVGKSPTDVPEQLLGRELASGPLSYCQVLTENTARFVFDVKLEYKAGQDLKKIGEILIKLEDGRTFGHVVLSQPIIAVPNSLSRISLLVHVRESIDKILAVKLYDYSTIPSVAKLENLPSMNENYFNAVSVLDLHKNSDGSDSPGIASRYGQGGFYWSFSEHDRVYSEELKTAFINANTLDLDLGIKNGETVILQVISGPGAGAVRHFKKEGTVLTNQGSAIPFFAQSSVVAIWRRITNPLQQSNGIPWPHNSDVPENWVLTRGANNEPVWSPASGQGGKANATLFIPPSKLLMNNVITTAMPGQLEYKLSDRVDSPADLLVMTSGVMQPRAAYSTLNDALILSSDVPTSMQLDVREFRREPSQGHALIVKVVEAFGDGINAKFKLPFKVESSAYTILVVGNVLQPTTAYKTVQDEVTTVEPIPSGQKVSLYAFQHEERPGWSSRTRVVQYRFPKAQDTFELPVTPLNKDYCIVNVGGLAAHTSEFSIVGNTLRTTTPVLPNTMVEVTIIENVMSIGTQDTDLVGVITDVIPGPSGYVFIRQGLPPLTVPFSVPNIVAGKGIKIKGDWPEIEIVSVEAENKSDDPKTVYNIQQRISDSEEIIVRQRIPFVRAIMVSATVDFAVELGPGFSATTGLEHCEYVLSLSNPTSEEAEYGRGIKGTGSCGFSSVGTATTETMAYANVSATQMYDLMIENHPLGYVEVVAKIRISNAVITSYGSQITANLCIRVEPK